MSPTQSTDTRSGLLFAFTAYMWWGGVALYIKLMDHIDAIEVTAHRALWSLPVAAVVLIAIGRTGDIKPTLASWRKMKLLVVSATVVSTNWLAFVWAVNAGYTLEAALGYYINPLITVAMGGLLLKEKFTRAQLVAILLAVIAVSILTVWGGRFPWVSFFLAITFALYGLIRKTIDVGPSQGFLIETMLIAPIALGYIFWIQWTGEAALFKTPVNFWLLAGCGPATAIPLMLYAAGARRLRLSTIGLMQYIVPTNLFLIGLFVFGEPFSQVQLIAFGLIWMALVIYSWSALRSQP